jgi:hypothetical protein
VHRGQGHALSPVPPRPCSPDCRPRPLVPPKTSPSPPHELRADSFARSARLSFHSVPAPILLVRGSLRPSPSSPHTTKTDPLPRSRCCLGDAVVGDAAGACLARSTGSSRCAAGSGPPHCPPVLRSTLGTTLRAATACSGGTTSCSAMSVTSPSP